MQGNNNNMQGRALKCIFPQWLPNAHAFTTVSHHNFFEIQLLSFKLGYSYQASSFQGLDSPSTVLLYMFNMFNMTFSRII